MPSLSLFRQQHPEYDDVDDNSLISAYSQAGYDIWPDSNQEASNDSGILSDLGKSAAKGIGQTIQGTGWLVGKVTGNHDMEDSGREIAQSWAEKQSPELKQQLQNVDDAKGFVDTAAATLTNPLAFADMIVSSLPAMIGNLGFARLGAEGVAKFAGKTAFTAAETAGYGATEAAAIADAAAKKSLEKGAAWWTAAGLGAGGEGLQSAGMTGSDVEKFYKDKGYNDDIAKEAANEAAIKSGASTAVLGGLGAKFETDALLGGLQYGGGKKALLDAGKEALEEGTQGPAEEYAAYEQKKKIDSDQQFDLGKSVAQNSLLGFGMGAPLAGVGYLANRGQDEQQDQTVDLSQNQTQPARENTQLRSLLDVAPGNDLLNAAQQRAQNASEDQATQPAANPSDIINAPSISDAVRAMDAYINDTTTPTTTNTDIGAIDNFLAQQSVQQPNAVNALQPEPIQDNANATTQNQGPIASAEAISPTATPTNSVDAGSIAGQETNPANAIQPGNNDSIGDDSLTSDLEKIVTNDRQNTPATEQAATDKPSTSVSTSPESELDRLTAEIDQPPTANIGETDNGKKQEIHDETRQGQERLLNATGAPDSKDDGAFNPTHVDPQDGELYQKVGSFDFIDSQGKLWAFDDGELDAISKNETEKLNQESNATSVELQDKQLPVQNEQISVLGSESESNVEPQSVSTTPEAAIVPAPKNDEQINANNPNDLILKSSGEDRYFKTEKSVVAAITSRKLNKDDYTIIKKSDVQYYAAKRNPRVNEATSIPENSDNAIRTETTVPAIADTPLTDESTPRSETSSTGEANQDEGQNQTRSNDNQPDLTPDVSTIEGAIVRASGKPYEKAQQAQNELRAKIKNKTLEPDQHDVIPVVGGYAIAPTASLNYDQYKALPRNSGFTENLLAQSYEAETGKKPESSNSGMFQNGTNLDNAATNTSIDTGSVSPPIESNISNQSSNDQAQPVLKSEELAKHLADAIRTNRINFRKNNDGNYDLKVNGVHVATIDYLPNSAVDASRQILNNYKSALEKEGKKFPTNPGEMSREQFVIANELGNLITDFEVSQSDIANSTGGLKINADGTFGIDHDALYDRIQQEKKTPNKLSSDQVINETTTQNQTKPVSPDAATSASGDAQAVGSDAEVAAVPSEDKESKKIEKANSNNFESFIANKQKINQSSITKHLTKEHAPDSDGNKTIKDVIENRINNGWKLKTDNDFNSDSYYKDQQKLSNHEAPGNPFRLNPVEAKELKQKLSNRDNYNTTTRKLVSPDGEYVLGKDHIGKIGLDYAEHLEKLNELTATTENNKIAEYENAKAQSESSTEAEVTEQSTQPQDVSKNAEEIDPTNNPENSPEYLIKIAADSIDKLRKPDVYRVLNNAPNDESRSNLAEYITKNRPELSDKVKESLDDINQLTDTNNTILDSGIEQQTNNAVIDQNNLLPESTIDNDKIKQEGYLADLADYEAKKSEIESKIKHFESNIKNLNSKLSAIDTKNISIKDIENSGINLNNIEIAYEKEDEVQYFSAKQMIDYINENDIENRIQQYKDFIKCIKG